MVLPVRVKVAMTEFDGIYYHYKLRTSTTDFLDRDIISQISNNPDQTRGSVIIGNLSLKRGYAEICE